MDVLNAVSWLQKIEEETKGELGRGGVPCVCGLVMGYFFARRLVDTGMAAGAQGILTPEILTIRNEWYVGVNSSS